MTIFERATRWVCCRAWIGFILAAGWVASGCTPGNRYILTLQPQGNEIHRELDYCGPILPDAARAAGHPTPQEFKDLSPAEIARLEKIYGPSKLTTPPVERVYAGTFGSKLPDDLHGFGRFRRFQSSLGEASVYAEQFRGNDDPVQTLDPVMHSADGLADLLVGWFRTQPAGPDRDKLIGFADTTLRHDIKNLYLLAWMQNAAHFESANQFSARLMLFLCQHGYLPSASFPTLVAGLQQIGNLDHPDDNRLLHLLQRGLTDKIIGPDQAVPACLHMLDDVAGCRESLVAYLRTTPQFKQAQAAWETTPPAQRAGKNPPDPFEVVGAGLGPPIDFADAIDEPDQLDVRLSVPGPPDSNGAWQPADQAVTWRISLSRSSLRLPPICYAGWSIPDAVAQTAHFGRVLLQGENLVNYVLWENGLNAAEAAEWQTFLATLKPGRDNLAAVKNFTFQDEKGGADALSADVRDLLTTALTPAAPPPVPTP
ncbi:MAG: hypothetical protein ACREJ2_18165 [Planctomycetota bacterium]